MIRSPKHTSRGFKFWALRTLSFMALASTLVAVGCATKPTLALHHAEISGINLQGVAVNVVVQVNNKNSFDVMVRNVNANVTMSDKYPLAPIAYNPNQWLPSKQSTLMPVPVTIPWQMVIPLLAETLGSDSIKYSVKGTADVTATRLVGIQINNEKLEESGSIPRNMVLAAARTTYPNLN